MDLTLTRNFSGLRLGNFLQWWGSGLIACLPPFMRRWFMDAPTRLVLEVVDASVVLVRLETAKGFEELGRFQLMDNALTEMLRRYRNRQRVFLLPASQALSRTISLPQAAENNLRQVISFELDRLTPFPATQLYFDTRVMERHDESRRLSARFIAVPKRRLEPLLEHLTKTGITPDRITVAGEPALNLLPEGRRPRRNTFLRRLLAILSVTVLVLVLATAFLPLWQQRELVRALMPRVDQAQQQAEGVFQLREELDRATELSQFLFDRKEAGVSPLAVINEMTALMPDGTWVEQLDIREGRIQVRGQSREASQLIGIVEASPFFSSANFISPVVSDPRSGQDRFHLSADIAQVQ